MNTSPHRSSYARYTTLLAALICAAASSLNAQTNIYLPTSGVSQWMTSANWDTGIVPNAEDATAILQTPTAANPGVQIASPGIDLGHLVVNVTAGGYYWGISGTGPIRWSASGTNQPSLTLNATAATQNITISANMADSTNGPPKALAIDQTGAAGSVINFSGNNSAFTGGFDLKASTNQTVSFLYANSLGSNTVNVLAGVKSIRLGYSTNTTTFSNNFNLSAGTSMNFLANGTTGKTILDGTISGAGAAQFWTYNGGSLELSGTNTYTGNTTIASGLKLIFHGVENFGTGSTITTALSGAAPTLIWAAGNTDDLTKKADGTTRIVGLGNGTNTFDVGANEVTLANAITGSRSDGHFVKEGAGILRLQSANSYGYNTTNVTTTVVSAGTLLVNNTTNSGTGLTAVTVKNTATLGGNGIISPGTNRFILVESNAVLSAGDSTVNSGIGHLTFNLNSTAQNLTFEDGSIVNVDLGDSFAADRISLIASGTARMVFSGDTMVKLFDHSTSGLSTNGVYVLFSAANSGIYNGLTLNSSNEITGGLKIAQDISGYTSSLWLDNGDIVLKVVPEPSTIVLLCLGLATLIFRRRHS